MRYAMAVDCSRGKTNVRMLLVPPHNHKQNHKAFTDFIKRDPGMTVEARLNCGQKPPEHIVSCLGVKECGISKTQFSGFDDSGVFVFAGEVNKCFTKEDHDQCKVTVDAKKGAFRGNGELIDDLAGIHTVPLPFQCKMTKFTNVLVMCKFRCDGVHQSCADSVLTPPAGKTSLSDPKVDPPLRDKKSLACECMEDGADFSEVCEKNNPCKNDGRCVAQGEKAGCICSVGFSGETCSKIDAKWENWSNCTGTCGARGKRFRNCTEGPEEKRGKTCEKLKNETGPDADEQACILGNACPNTGEGILNITDTGLLAIGDVRPADQRITVFDILLFVVAGVLLVAAAYIILKFFCCPSLTVDIFWCCGCCFKSNGGGTPNTSSASSEKKAALKGDLVLSNLPKHTSKNRADDLYLSKHTNKNRFHDKNWKKRNSDGGMSPSPSSAFTSKSSPYLKTHRKRKGL